MKRFLTLGVLGLAGGLALAACSSSKDDPLTIGPRARSSAALKSFESCSALEASLKSHLKEELRVQLLELLDARNARASFEGGDAAPAAGAPPDRRAPQQGAAEAGTNNQEAGVDEADFVKTDGYFIYVLNGGKLEIFGVPEFGQLVPTSETVIEGEPSQMLLAGSRAVVFSAIYPWNLPPEHPLRGLMGWATDTGNWWYRVDGLTKLTVLDLTDHTKPQLVREVYLEGYYQTARKIESTVRMISYGWLSIEGLRYWPELPDSYYTNGCYGPLGTCPDQEAMLRDAVLATIDHNNAVIDATPLSEFIPQLYERAAGSDLLAHTFTDQDCKNFAAADDAVSRGVTSILTLDLLGEGFGFDADHIVSNTSTVYASATTLLIAEPAQDWWWFWNNDDFEFATNLHRFDTSTPGVTTYSGSGRIDGMIRNQFSLSEHEGFVRVAATTHPWRMWWTEDDTTEPDNHIFVLAGEDKLELVGRLDGIGTGERIWSSRFVGPKAYVVTFRSIDPLWTIDLSDPTKPSILGELQVPGVSTYIHPLGDGHLLTIGMGGDDNRLDWGSTQISLFDVTDQTRPALASKLDLARPTEGDWVWSYSEALYEHKAFQYWGPKAMLAVPVSTYRSWYNSTDQSWGWDYYSLLNLVSVDVTGGLSLYGSIDHSSFYDSDRSSWWAFVDVRRSIFMGEYIYALSDRGITAHRLSDLVLTASAPLPGTSGYPFYGVE